MESFLKEKRRQGCSSSTLELYRSHLTDERIRTFLADQEITGPDGFTDQALRDFESELQGVGMASTSVHRRHVLLKNFLGFALKRGMTTDHQVRDVTAPKQTQRAPGIISVEQEKLLLAKARCPRDRFIIQFLIGTGLRRSELLNLTLDDIQTGYEGDNVRVRLGKGGKDRVVPLDSSRMGVELTRLTRRYIERDRPSDTGRRELFLTSRKEGGDYQPLSAMGLRSILRRLGQDTGIDCHPHLFRHSYGTRAIQSNVPAMAVMRLMGHTTLDMVNRYVHYDDASLVDALN